MIWVSTQPSIHLIFANSVDSPMLSDFIPLPLTRKGSTTSPLAERSSPSLAFLNRLLVLSSFPTLHKLSKCSAAKRKNYSPAALPPSASDRFTCQLAGERAHRYLTSAQLVFQVIRHHAALHLLRPRVLVIASLVATVRDRHLLGLLAVLCVL